MLNLNVDENVWSLKKRTIVQNELNAWLTFWETEYPLHERRIGQQRPKSLDQQAKTWRKIWSGDPNKMNESFDLKLTAEMN